MGSCLSCLGIGRSSRSSDESAETRRLLSSDPYRAYNGLDQRQTRWRDVQQQQQQQQSQPDPEASRREQQALEGICHSMTDGIVDVFTTLPPPVMADSAGSSMGTSVEHLHLATRRIPAPPEEELEPDEEEEEEEEEEDDDEEAKGEGAEDNEEDEEEEEEEDDVDDDDDDNNDHNSGHSSEQDGLTFYSSALSVKESVNGRPHSPFHSVRKPRNGGTFTYLDKEESEAAKLAMG